MIMARFRAWGDRDVLLRFIEAADTVRRLPRVQGPAGFKSGMPEVIRGFADALGAEETREKTEWHDSFNRRQTASAAAIGRMEQVFEWHRTYLRDRPAYARCLWEFAMCKAYHRSFRAVCKRKGWKRPTAYRRVDEAMTHVRNSLNKAKVPLVEADIEGLDTMDHLDIGKVA